MTTDPAAAASSPGSAGPDGTAIINGSAGSADDQIGLLRQRIDTVDDEIIRLVNERVALSKQVGKLRASVGGPRLSITREHQIMGKFAQAIGPHGSALALLLLKISRGRL